jgi:hypothetical protein
VPRTLGLLARSLFGLNGLLTVWCLGCCGFEPLVGSGRMAEECASTVTESGAPGDPIAWAPNTDAPDCGCACQSCCAVSAVRLAFGTGSTEPQALPLAISESLISISPEPQYPPPKLLPLRA